MQTPNDIENRQKFVIITLCLDKYLEKRDRLKIKILFLKSAKTNVHRNMQTKIISVQITTELNDY